MLSTAFSRPVFALADVNSMYCSCERVFRPDLRNTPLIVLSNNDDCAIAQTSEIKALGIEMAQPWYQVEKMALAHGVVPFSSNYELYADFSNRFIETLKHFTPRLEVYSIDECFLDLTGFSCDLVAYGQKIKATVLQWTKLPICVGIGHSKTLAKLANKIAKKHPQFNGVCDFTSISSEDLDAIMEQTDVTKLWGIGSRMGIKLNHVGINNVLRLKRADPKRIRDQFGVLIERIIMELNGEAWLDMLSAPAVAKQVMSSRSFGDRVTRLQDVQEAVSFHATNAGQRLRKHGLYVNVVHCFIQNSPFDEKPFYQSRAVALPSPTDSTFKIAEAALWMLKHMYVPGIRYQKAGVMLMELVPEAGQQTDLFGYSSGQPQSNNLMETVDSLNSKYGRGTIRLASEGVKQAWGMRRNKKSPNYTCDWADLPVIGKRFDDVRVTRP